MYGAPQAAGSPRDGDLGRWRWAWTETENLIVWRRRARGLASEPQGLGDDETPRVDAIGGATITVLTGAPDGVGAKQVTRNLAWYVERESGVKACRTYGHVLSTTTLLVPLGRASDPEAGVRPLCLAASLPPCLTVSTGDSSEVTL